MQIRVYESFEEALVPWRQLVPHAAFLTPFLKPDWSLTWWKNFCVDGAKTGVTYSLHIIVAYVDERPIALAPFYYVSSHEGSVSELRLIGDLGRDEGLTEAPIVIWDNDYQDVATQAILDHVRTDTGRNWDVAKVRWQTYGEVEEETTRGPLFHKTVVEPGRQVVLLPDTYKAYRASLSRSMRKKLAYYPQRLDKKGCSWSVRFLVDPTEVRDAVDDLVALHRARALSRRGPSHLNHFPYDSQKNFLKDMLYQLATRKEACMAILEVDGKAVATQCVLRSENEIILYYSGFDPAWYDYSPLTILLAAIIERGIGEGCTRLNFLFALAPWKRRWNAITETTIHIDYQVALRPISLWRVARAGFGHFLTDRLAQEQPHD